MEWTIKNSNNYIDYIQKYQVNSLLAKILAYKEFDEKAVQSIMQERLIFHDFSLFSDADIALDRIQEAIENEEKICIYGDYDCDGILATTILVDTFRQLDVQVGYHIPNRTIDGYGLNVERVEQVAEKGYQLIITVDNGVKAFEAVEKANELGVDVIITDHHSFEDELPDACAIIHTKASSEYPFKEISGGFVAYKLASALLGKHDKYLFSLAACTTISDMMPLLDENRSLVKRGLQFMKEEKFLPLELLLGNNQTYSVQSLGFIIAPKINSFGRLCEMVNPNHVVKYFLQGTEVNFVQQLATQAVKVNSKRQELTQKQYLEVKKSVLEDDAFLYCHDIEIHEGIVGLVAGKYTREYYRPSFVMHYDEKNQVFKGSARGIQELPLTDIFEHVKDSLVTYGGHALAGGFSVTKENCVGLKEKIQEYITQTIDVMPEKKIEALRIDQGDITKNNIESLEVLQPLGNGNEEVVLCVENLQIDKVYTLSEGKHLKFDLHTDTVNLQALFFNQGSLLPDYVNETTISLVGKLSINRFRNMESINMIVEGII
ncbi:MAG: single-stranded-DNA-specific exonuclease RecJ [Coprobacillaceae bacterium]